MDFQQLFFYQKLKSGALEKQNSDQKVIYVALSFTAVVYSCLLVLLGLIKANERKDYIPVKRLSTSCVDLSGHPDDDFRSFSQNEDGFKVLVDRKFNYICEAKNAAMMIERIVEKEQMRQLALGLWRNKYLSCGNRDHALKSGDLTAIFSKVAQQWIKTDDALQEKVLWDNNGKYSFMDPKLAYRDGELTIPEGRIYFVYAFITFNLNHTHNDNQNNSIRLSLRLCRRTLGYEQTLSAKTEVYRHCTNTVTSLAVYSYMLLHKGDSLFVRVSDGRNVDTTRNGNAFGIFPLS